MEIDGKKTRGLRRKPLAAPPRPASAKGDSPPRPAPTVWGNALPLFPPVIPLAQQALDRLPEALEKVWPLNAAHRRSLPADIADLSAILTSERARLRHSYWSRPNFVSAYLYYFLPWNILRLARLFGGLELPDGPPGKWLVDAGAGPLALPIALWLSGRAGPCNVLAMDRNLRAMRLGLDIFRELGEMLRKPLWPVRLARQPLAHAPALLAGLPEKPWLFTAANVLNEMLPPRRSFAALEEEDGNIPDEEGRDAYFAAVRPFLDQGAGFLAIEPGTRLGGTAIMRLRAQALEEGYYAHAPCPHQNVCPLAARYGEKRSLGSAWCHFTFDVAGAPNWLLELSREAGLAKKSLSLAPLLLSAAPPKERGIPGGALCRVVSQTFAIPALSPFCRYGCEKQGLAVLPDSRWLADGALLPVRLPQKPARDKKSGAEIVAPLKAMPQKRPSGRGGAQSGKSPGS